MLVVRIIGKGYDINGNWKNNIVAYKQVKNDDGLIMCNYIAKECLKSLFDGRYNAKSHTLTTFATKGEIVARLEKYQKWSGVTIVYIFE